MQESQLSYESSQDQLDEYTITAPISGTVIEKDIKAGDTLESNNSSSTTLCVIADMSVMTLTIDVDELDIAQLKEGQGGFHYRRRFKRAELHGLCRQYRDPWNFGGRSNLLPG